MVIKMTEIPLLLYQTIGMDSLDRRKFVYTEVYTIVFEHISMTAGLLGIFGSSI